MRPYFLILFLIIQLPFKAQTDTTALLQLFDKGSEIIRSNTDSAFLMADSLIRNSRMIHFTKGEILGLHLKGDVHIFFGDYDSATVVFLKSIELSRQLKSSNMIAASLNKMGTLMAEQKEFNRALDYFFEAETELVKNSTRQELGMLYSQIGAAYRKKLSFDSAVIYQKKALDIAYEINDQFGISACLNNIGTIYQVSHHPDSAIPYFRQALKIKMTLNDKKGVANTSLNLGGALFGIGQNDSALFYLHSAIDTARKLHLKEYLQRGYGWLQQIYSAEGDYKKAFEYLALHKAYSDSILNEANTKSINENEARFQNKLKTKELEQLGLEKSLADDEIKRQNLQKLLFAIGFGAVGILAFIIFRSYRRKSRDAMLIAVQKTEIEHQKHIVEEKQKEVIDSIRYARRLQHAILPPERIWFGYLPDSFILYLPKDIVAGDFYWMEKIVSRNHQLLCLAVADCTGHGVPGAMVSVVCSNALNRAVKEYGLFRSGEILNKVRDLVIETFEKSESEVQDGMDISLCVIDVAHKKLTWSGANNALWLVRNQALQEFAPDKQPIGIYQHNKPFTTNEIDLESGDQLYLFTDGYADQFGGPKGKKFKYSQQRDLVLQLSGFTMSEQKQRLLERHNEWRGDVEQIDDICIAGIRIA